MAIVRTRLKLVSSKKKESVLNVFVRISRFIASIDFQNVEIGSDADLDKVIAYVAHVLRVFTYEKQRRHYRRRKRKQNRRKSYKESDTFNEEPPSVVTYRRSRNRNRKRQPVLHRSKGQAVKDTTQNEEVTSPSPQEPFSRDEPPKLVQREMLNQRKQRLEESRRKQRSHEDVSREENTTTDSDLFIWALLIVTVIVLLWNFSEGLLILMVFGGFVFLSIYSCLLE